MPLLLTNKLKAVLRMSVSRVGEGLASSALGTSEEAPAWIFLELSIFLIKSAAHKYPQSS